MIAVMASLGFSSGGRSGSAPKFNQGEGTVFGDSDAKSDSIKRSIDRLGDIDTELLGVSRQMASSLSRTCGATIRLKRPSSAMRRAISGPWRLQLPSVTEKCGL